MLPTKSEKNHFSVFENRFEKMPSLQDAIMHTEIPAKMRRILQAKDFVLE
jgi:hypothetical protein